MTRARFVAVGECMVELFSEDPLPIDRAERFRSSFGGDAMQAALTAARLGTPSAVVTVAGDDPFASALIRWLEAEGISTELVVRRPGFTGLYLISIDGAAERSFVYYRKGSAASTLQPSDVTWSEPPEALLISGITQAVADSSRRTALEAARRTHEAGGLVVFDANYRPSLWDGNALAAREAFEDVLPYCDAVRAGAPEETAVLTDEADPAEAARALAARVRIALIGCGAEGAVLAGDGMIERIPAPPVTCIDTTGAGDALTGGFVHGLLAGMPPAEAARLGVAAGAVSVTRRGGAGSMPPGDEVLQLFQQTAAGV